MVVRDRDDNRARLGGENRRAMKSASLGWFFDNFAARWAGSRHAARAMSGDRAREMAKRTQSRAAARWCRPDKRLRGVRLTERVAECQEMSGRAVAAA